MEAIQEIMKKKREKERNHMFNCPVCNAEMTVIVEAVIFSDKKRKAK